MRITILGSGTAVPSFDRFPSAMLVESCGLTILVDAGPGVLRRAAQIGVSPADIDVVLLTHFHTDHTADIAALLFALRNPGFAGRPPLRILGAKGLVTLVETLTKAWPWLRPKNDDYELCLEEIGAGQHILNGPDGALTLDALKIRHTAQSLGYRLTEPDGTAAAFSGDADECPELVELARGSHLFVCDCAFPDEKRVDGHLTPSSAGAHAAAAQAPLLVPIHFYPECDGVDITAQIRRTYAGEVALAEDLLTFEGQNGAFRTVDRHP